MNNGARAFSWVATVLLAVAAGVPLVVLAAPQVSARSIMITPDGSGEYPTIQAALVAAADGDSIILANGTYLGDGNRDIDFLGKAVTIASRSGSPQDCVIDCQGTAEDPHRAFWFHSGEGVASVLQSITLRNGWVAGSGGAVLCEPISDQYSNGPTILSCILTDNSAVVSGGAIASIGNCGEGNSMRIRDTRFLRNQAGRGGGMSLGCLDSPDAVDCIFADNHATDGGALAYGGFCYGALFTHCVFERNFATSRGGATFGLVETYVRYVECRFSRNTAGAMGGGSYIPSDGKAYAYQRT